ncbi:hypothetical protein CMU70_18495 [Elizabethkingia anophelis]|nr:hypothetical protein [Elizabethkingia anophelis]
MWGTYTSVGSKVITAKFKIVRNLQLLDLRNLKNAIESVSVFHPAYKQKMEKAVFISKLSKIITQPVMPGDEVFEYLPTQAIADFLSAQYRVVYDGIIFPSVQVKGEDKINVVLFNKSSKVRSYYLPKGTRTRVQDEEPDDYGTWKFYQVTHLVPPLKNIESDAENNSQVENANLEIEINSIEVNDINAVQFTWESHSVSRVKIENYKSPLTN